MFRFEYSCLLFVVVIEILKVSPWWKNYVFKSKILSIDSILRIWESIASHIFRYRFHIIRYFILWIILLFCRRAGHISRYRFHIIRVYYVVRSSLFVEAWPKTKRSQSLKLDVWNIHIQVNDTTLEVQCKLI